MDHLAIPVSDQERSRRFYERYFGFGARPARRYDDCVLMLYHRRGCDAVHALRDRLLADGVELVEQWDEPGYVSVKCRDPDGYIVEAFWEASG
jgi:catechol 2,3-dioxygenase-like lactoylglutathione lyase family enzyme